MTPTSSACEAEVASPRKKAAPALDDHSTLDDPTPVSAQEIVATWAAEFQRWAEGAADVRNMDAGLAQKLAEHVAHELVGPGSVETDVKAIQDAKLGAKALESHVTGIVSNVEYVTAALDALHVHQIAEKLLHHFLPDAYAKLRSTLEALNLKYPPPSFATGGDPDLNMPSMDAVLRSLLSDASFVGRLARKPDYVVDVETATARAGRTADSEALQAAIETHLQSALADWAKRYPKTSPRIKTIVADICCRLKRNKNKKLRVKSDAVRKRLRLAHLKLFADD
jgi:hypothetical protein